MGSAVETVGADAAFWQADSIDHVFDGAEAKRGEAETPAYFLNHALILRGVGCGVGLDGGFVGFLPFEVGYHTTGDEFKNTFGGAEINELAWIDERGA